MFKWVGKQIGDGTLEKARKLPAHFIQGIIDLLEVPFKIPKKAWKLWESLPNEDRALFRKAVLSAAKIAAKKAIEYETTGRIKF